MDEAIRRTLPGVVGIHLDDGTCWILESESALAEPVDAHCVLRYDEVFKGVHGIPFFVV